MSERAIKHERTTVGERLIHNTEETMNNVTDISTELLTGLSGVRRLTKKDLDAARVLTDDEARYLVDYYYLCQDDRKRANNQVRAMTEDSDGPEPSSLVAWLAEQADTLENQIKRALDVYTQAHEMGSWMREIVGIGPVISAGLLAHIDIEKAPTVGHIWRFAGLDPTLTWDKGQKRPWNAKLKTLCWKTGQSFMKLSNHEKGYYGQLYRQRKDYEIARNDSGTNAALAAELAPKFGKTTEAHGHYMAGHLPPAQIDARARRYAVKQFLADLHGEWFRRHFGTEPPLPYPIAILGHAHLRKV